MMAGLGLVVILSLIVTCNCANIALQYTECQSTSQCGPGRCCVVVRGRFDTTACQPLLKVGEQCRPASYHPYNTTLDFPGGGSPVTVTEVHQSLCPCEPQAACIRGYCVPRDEETLVVRI